MNRSGMSPQALSSITFGINNTHGQELSTEWTLPHYFHKPPTPTCWLQISRSFGRSRCSLPCVLKPPLRSPGKWKGNILQSPLPRALHQDPEAWEFYPGERKQELPSQIHLPPWDVVFNCSLKSFSKLFKALSAHSGQVCWTPRAAMASFLLSIMGRETLHRASTFPFLFQWGCSTNYWCSADGWDIFHWKLLTTIHVLFSKYLYLTSIFSLVVSMLSTTFE